MNSETLKARCHCGAVEFEVNCPQGLQNLMRCNCSLCLRRGAVMATASLAELKVTKGQDKLSLYQWNAKIAKHYFCSICGIYTHHQRRKNSNQYGFNVACVEGLDWSEIGEVPMTDGTDIPLVEQE